MVSRYAVVDVETTGLGAHDRIVEVAVITLNSEGRAISAFESVVNPGREPGPTELHRLTAEDCARAPTFRDIAHTVYQRLAGAQLVGHNVRFDWRYLREEFERCGLRFLREGRGVCTVEGCRRLGLPMRLNDARAALGIFPAAPHSALADAAAAAQLWISLRRRGAFAGESFQILGHALGVERLPPPSAPRPRGIPNSSTVRVRRARA